ncbi:MAG: hypothetical protein JW744_05995 [Candidatus Diapherotrites archaeon]|uniref:Xylose isomerase-like TIM barrel domain-containing protein n=1 Tax=Candidatus Iainarchaeum sp. TaxID=3101447 RepID=A0A938YZ41_9ARCH|nr:hypothetical protein [Candidatus Diapherotrites archaeon]
MIGLSSSYFAFRGKGVFDSVKAVFDLGFDTVELGAAHRFEGNAWETVKGIKKEFPDKNYTVHSLFPPPRERYWFNPSLGLTKQNKQNIDNLFRAAEIVEAEVVGIHPGFLNELGWGFDRRKGFDTLVAKQALDPEQCWANFNDLVGYAMALSGNLGIGFAVENIHGIEARPLVNSIEEFQRVFKAFPEMKLLFDFGHALFEGSAESIISNFSSRIGEVHMHWSLPLSKKHDRDDHSAITSQKQLEIFKKVKQLKSIPVIFEHGTNVNEGQVLAEKKIVEAFLKGL